MYSLASWVIISFLSLLYGVNAVHYNYEDTNSWCKSGQYPACCGHSQSPIAIFRNESENAYFEDLKFINYGLARIAVSEDDGQTVVISFKKNPLKKDPKVAGGNLKSAYIFSSLHFHWGPDNTVGSEHTIDGKSYPLEMHLVHYNEKYGSREKALDKSDGILVLGVLFKICKPGDYFSNILNEVLKNDIYFNESPTLLKALNLRNFLPINVRSYFTYKGSLTTPPCSEIVTWIVFENPVCIKEKLMKNFHTHVHSHKQIGKKQNQENDDVIHDNHRPTQKGQTKRKVFWNK